VGINRVSDSPSYIGLFSIGRVVLTGVSQVQAVIGIEVQTRLGVSSQERDRGELPPRAAPGGMFEYIDALHPKFG
jgi:hypothetical protein